MPTRYEDDINELRRQFAKVDTDDPTSIQKWFAEHPYLTTNDHARIADKSTHWVRRMKRRANIKGRTPANLPKSTRRKKVDTLVAPTDWDNEEWLRKAAKFHAVIEISRATGVSTRTIYRRLRKYDIEPLGEKILEPKNPYFTHQWCYEHYVTRGWGQSKCAKTAGVCQQTFSNWLNKLKIPVRSNTESHNKHKDTKIWVRKAIHNLKNQDIVRRVYLRDDHIHVRFMNFFWESYYIEMPKRKKRIPHSFSITKEEAKLEKVPPTVLEYESSMDGTELYPAHVTIRRKEWKKASFLEQRLALHEFTRVINRRGWVWPTYPDKVIEAELERLRNSNQAKFMDKGVFTAHPRYGRRETAGFRIIEHFFGLEPLWEAVFKSPKRTMRVMNELSKLNSRINFHNAIRVACYHNSDPSWKIKIYDPGMYTWIFKRLGLKGTVLDLYPNNGHRAIACAVSGLKYTTVPTPQFQKAIDNGFAEFIGLDYEPYDGGKVDIVLSDDDFRHTNIDKAMEYASRTKRLLHFVERRNKGAAQAKYKPERIIQVKTNIYRTLPDYLFIF